MAEKFRFMDPVQLPDGTYDREYNAQEFTDYFKALITTGVMKSVGNQLAVSANGANMVTRIDTGLAFILGRYYENDSFKEHTHDTETLGNSRIDRIVVRMDLSPDKRSVLSYIKKGAPSANPVAPTLTQTQNIYEISLAQVKVVGGQTFIATNAVIDERGTNVICPWAGSNILPSFDDNALGIHIKDDKRHLTATDITTLLNTASKLNQEYNTDPNTTLASMILTNINTPTGGFWYIGTLFYANVSAESNRAQFAISYDSPNFAFRRCRGGTWSPWSITGDPNTLITANKTFSGAINELFLSVSNGKAAIANAITQMGVATPTTSEFATMAANILNLSNIVSGTGTITSNSSQTFFAVSGLDFTPRAIMFRARGGNINAWGVYNRNFAANEFTTVIGGTNNGNVFSVFHGGFDVKVANPGGTGLFDWWAIK